MWASTNSWAIGTACWCTSLFLFPEITIRYNMQEKISMLCCSHSQTILWLNASTTNKANIISTFLICSLYCYHKCVNISCFFVQHEPVWFPQCIWVCLGLMVLFCCLFFVYFFLYSPEFARIFLMKYHWLTEFVTIPWIYNLYSKTTH